MSSTASAAAPPADRDRLRPAARHRQAVPGRHRQRRHQHRRTPRHDPRDRGRERRRQVDADEDPLRRPATRLGHHRDQRRAGRACTRRQTPSATASAWSSSTSCWPTTSPSSRTSSSAPRSCTASAAPPAPRSSGSPTPTASASSPTAWSRSSASAPGSGSRSSRCSTAAPSIVILDEPTAVLVPQEVDELFGNLRGLKAGGPQRHLHLPQARRGALRRRRDHRDPARHDREDGLPQGGHRPPAGRADGRLRAALAEHRDLDGDRDGPALGQGPRRCRARTAARCSTTSPSTSTRARCSASPASRATARPSWSSRSWACAPGPPARSSSAGSDLSPLSTRERREAGIGYIPEDRHRHGLLLDAPLWENRVLGHQTRPPSTRRR